MNIEKGLGYIEDSPKFLEYVIVRPDRDVFLVRVGRIECYYYCKF